MQDQGSLQDSPQAKDGAPRRPSRKGSPQARAWILGLAVVALGLIAVSYFGRDKEPPAQTTNRTLRQGLEAHRAGRFEEAAGVYQSVLETDPGNKYASFNLGVLDQRRGLTASAERYYRRSLETDPKFEPALYNLALLKEKADANDEAAELYRRLLEVNPKHAAGHLNLGFLLTRKLGKAAEGREHILRAVQLEPKFASRVPRSLPSS